MPIDPENKVQRQLCLLVLDASASMGKKDPDSGRIRIDLLNEGIKTLRDKLSENEKARYRVQIAVVVLGGAKNDARVVLDWTDGDQWVKDDDYHRYPLKAGHETPLGAGMMLALDMIEQQKKALKEFGITYYRPWLFVMTDGEPTDDAAVWQTACRTARDYESRNKVIINSIGVGEVNPAKLEQLSVKPPFLLKTVDFQTLFEFIASSIEAGVIGPDPWRGVADDRPQDPASGTIRGS